MQKIINIASFLCVFIVLLIACTVNEGIYGKWQAKGDTKIFDKEINIVKLRTREGANFPYYTLIYDNNYHGSACQTAENKKEFCAALLLKTTKIHPTDEISSVIAAPIKGRDYYLDAKIEYRFGETLLYWKMIFPQYNNQEITEVYTRPWF